MVQHTHCLLHLDYMHTMEYTSRQWCKPAKQEQRAGSEAWSYLDLSWPRSSSFTAGPLQGRKMRYRCCSAEPAGPVSTASMMRERPPKASLIGL